MSQNLVNLERVAEAMERVGVRHAFVGGATIALYLDALGAAQARATEDVDCIVASRDRTAHAALEARLRAVGFEHDTARGAPICRWRFDGVVVDIMPTDERILGFSNPFYGEALNAAAQVTLPTGRVVPCLTLAYTIATKVVAFEGRGAADPWASKDLEDLVAIFDGAAEPVSAVASLPDAPRTRVVAWARATAGHAMAADWIEGHLPRGPGFGDRVAQVITRLGQVARLA